jgi:hypothetical protein
MFRVSHTPAIVGDDHRPELAGGQLRRPESSPFYRAAGREGEGLRRLGPWSRNVQARSETRHRGARLPPLARLAECPFSEGGIDSVVSRSVCCWRSKALDIAQYGRRKTRMPPAWEARFFGRRLPAPMGFAVGMLRQQLM